MSGDSAGSGAGNSVSVDPRSLVVLCWTANPDHPQEGLMTLSSWPGRIRVYHRDWLDHRITMNRRRPPPRYGSLRAALNWMTTQPASSRCTVDWLAFRKATSGVGGSGGAGWVCHLPAGLVFPAGFSLAPGETMSTTTLGGPLFLYSRSPAVNAMSPAPVVPAIPSFAFARQSGRDV